MSSFSVPAITLRLIPAPSATVLEGTLHTIKQNTEISTTVLPELVSLIGSKQPMNAPQFGHLCAHKEATADSMTSISIPESISYINNIITHSAFNEFASRVLGSQAARMLMPHITRCTEQLQTFYDLTVSMAKKVPCFTENILSACAKDANKTCYLPGGWCGPTGQVVVIKATVCRASQVVLHVINRRPIDHIHKPVENDSLLNNLSNPGSIVDLELEAGKQLFQELSTLLFPAAPPTDDIELGDLHFYGRLLAYTKPVEEADDVGRPSKFRFYGQSSAAAIISMFADIFHSAGAPVVQHRKFVLAIKLFALIQEFSVYEHSDLNYHLMQEALNKTLVRAAKVGPESCDTALIEVLCKDMQKRLLVKRENHLQTLTTGTSMPCNGVCSVPECTSEEENTFRNHVHSSNELRFFPFTTPKTPEDIIPQLKSFAGYNSRNMRGHISLRGFFRDVPCTSNTQFWDGIDPANALELLECLRGVVAHAVDGYNRQARGVTAEIALLALDMAAVCAEKIPSLKFDKLYTLELNVLTGHDAAFSDPDAVRNLERVKANFERRAKDRVALLGAKIDLQNGAEVTYLLNHIITESELENLLKKYSELSRDTVVKKYFTIERVEEFPGLPGIEFSTPLQNLMYLANLFVSTALHEDRSTERSYSSKSGMLKALPEWSATDKSDNRSLPHEFFQTHGGLTDYVLQDDRQNLYWAIKPDGTRDLASRKVGALYNSYRQSRDDYATL